MLKLSHSVHLKEWSTPYNGLSTFARVTDRAVLGVVGIIHLAQTRAKHHRVSSTEFGEIGVIFTAPNPNLEETSDNAFSNG